MAYRDLSVDSSHVVAFGAADVRGAAHAGKARVSGRGLFGFRSLGRLHARAAKAREVISAQLLASSALGIESATSLFLDATNLQTASGFLAEVGRQGSD
ncbi:MAG TPA: hypothetical protein VI231_22310 [Candidatus Binatia bacterium]